MHLEWPRVSLVAEGTLRKTLANWPAPIRRLAWRLIGKYSMPKEATDHLLLWFNNEPWRRTVLYREGPLHRFPYSHYDVLEQAVEYRVPIEKMSELAAFNGSVVVNRTKGEVAVCCAHEELNTATINLAAAVVRGEHTAITARAKLSEVIQARRLRWPVALAQQLQFSTLSQEVEHGTPGTADPDQPQVRREFMQTVTE